MVHLVLKFAAAARGSGLRVSSSEVLDCLRQLELVDVLDERQFAAVLRANFAKSRREQGHFERLYELFFHELRQDERVARSEPLAAHFQAALGALNDQAAESTASQAVMDFLGGDPGALLEKIQGMAGGSEDGSGGGMGANLGAVTRRLEFMLALNAAEAQLELYLEGQRDNLSWEQRQDLLSHIRDRLNSARRLLYQDRRQSPGREVVKDGHRRRFSDLGEVHFASLTRREVESMREAIEQLVRKINDTISRRRAAGRRGSLDVKKTLRRAAAYNGVPMELYFRHRPLRKAKIVALCDVSGSVWSAARFMLNMLYSLQDCFTQVRSFIFVAGIVEVTDIFEAHEINQAIEKILKEADIEYNAATDYGLTLRQFKQNHLDILNQKTTVIIIGDARSNYGNPEAGILEEIRERSRRVVWLNPETQMFWNTGDSEMKAYEPCCDEVRPCQNLNQLMAFISSLVL
jgi:uncharacterized protein with von Willebrand factor type A (vWA) domain